MSPEEIESIGSLLVRYGFEAVIAGFVVFLLIKHFLPGYLSQKGKNLATQEDIENITDKVESVKSGYAEVLEEIKSNNQIKIAAIEREKLIKKEVYMEAVEAITRSQNMLSSFSNLNITEEQLSADFSNDSGKIAKVQLVGEKDTVRAVTYFMGEIGAAFLDLMLERSSLMQRKTEIQTAEHHRNQYQSEVERYLALMKNLNLEGNTNQGTWDYVNSSFKFEGEQRDKLNDEINSLLEIQNSEHLVFIRKCMDRFFEISAFLPEAVLSVRKELELEIDACDYVEIFDSNLEKGKAVFNDFLSKIESQNA